MADWSNLSRSLESGYLMGRQTGSRVSNLGKIIASVAGQLRTQREAGEEQGRKVNLLGVEGLMTGRLAPAEVGETGTTFDLPMGRFKPVKEPREWKPTTKEEALEFEEAKAGLKPKLTLSGALGIISDPMKAMQTKRNYPNLYAEAERIVKAQLGEDILSKISPTLKTPGKLPTKISPTEDIIDTNW